MKRLLLTNARVVFANETRDNVAVLIEDGKIAALDPGASGNDAQTVDLSGCMLMPGMIDLHCDALEKEVEPRPNVNFPLDLACAQADKRNALAGITTVYHALSFANHELGVRNNSFAAEIARAVCRRQVHALVDNRVHARYEVTDRTAPGVLAELLENGHAHMISFMDHTPGQGQFKDVAAFRNFLAKTYKTSDSELDVIIATKTTAGEHALERMETLSAIAKRVGVAIASHDDDTPDKIDVVASLGAVISEFPINLETALAAKAKGVATLFGAPNVLRGKSQSGSMRALDAIMSDAADCLCSDYSPAALLSAVLRLPDLAGIDLHEAISLVTCNPARAAGLKDRGEIAVGKRADLVAVRVVGGLPQAERVWVRGEPALSIFFGHE